jgi:superfamily II DNA or RNA helicase
LNPSARILFSPQEQLAAVHSVLAETKRLRAVVGSLLVEGGVAFLQGTAGKRVQIVVAPEGALSIERLAEEVVTAEALAQEEPRRRTPSRAQIAERRLALSHRLRAGLARLQQLPPLQAAIAVAAERLESREAAIRLYPAGPLESKAIILEGADAALLTASNPLLSQTDRTSVATFIQGPGTLNALTPWFEEIWDRSRDVRELLLAELRACWAVAEPSPYEIYLKLAYHLSEDRLVLDEDDAVLWDDRITETLTEFQRDAVRHAIRLVDRHGGCFVADVVGLGKSFIGAAILKHLERTQGDRALILCPAALVDMWEEYNELYELNARVVSTGLLREDSRLADAFALEDDQLRGRTVVLVDESHAFRNPRTQRYQLLERFLGTGRKAVLLTATPLNKSAWDVYHQLKLFHQEDQTYLPVSPPNLRRYFRRVEQGQADLPSLLAHVLIRRTRRDIIRQYGIDEETDERIDPRELSSYLSGARRAYVRVGERRQFFPARRLTTLGYSIEATYQGLYSDIRSAFAPAQGPAEPGLRFAFYDRAEYVREERRDHYVGLGNRTANLAGLMRILLFKRLESSVASFRATVARMLSAHQYVLRRLDRGGEEEREDVGQLPSELEQRIEDRLQALERDVPLRDLDADRFATDLQGDIGILQRMLERVQPIGPAEDAKVQVLLAELRTPRLEDVKILVFTEFSDTANYLYDVLSPEHSALDICTGKTGGKSQAAARFAPNANRNFARRLRGPEIRVLVATDVMSEGLNLQDCNVIINYDLHWNPVRLIQRFGRVDRIGTEHGEIYAYNFLPETSLDQNLGLAARLRSRILDIHLVIGEDTAILDPTEQINERAMYAIYGEEETGLGALEAEDSLSSNALVEAEALMADLQEGDRDYFDEIASLPDALRATRESDGKEGVLVLLRAGEETRVIWSNTDGTTEDPDVGTLLERARCAPDEPKGALPDWLGAAVEAAKGVFREELAAREGWRTHRVRLPEAQRKVVQRLRAFESTLGENEEVRVRLRVVLRAFGSPVSAAVRRRLKGLLEPDPQGRDLLRALTAIYHDYNLSRRAAAVQEGEGPPTVRVLCSMSFVTPQG